MIECKLLFVDDDEMIRRVMERGLSTEITNVTCVSSSTEALAKLETENFDVVVTDLRMTNTSSNGELEGLNLIRVIRERSPETEVIMQTGYGSQENVDRALHAGVFDYLEKPYKVERLTRMIERALEQRRMRLELSSLRQQVAFEYGFDGLVGSTPRMLAVKEQVVHTTECDSPVLITGGAGAGKAHLARTIHHHSRRRRQTMITFDCSATAERLIDTELFGSRDAKGGRITRRTPGWFRQAHGGSILIKHIDRLPMVSQAQLLEALDKVGAWSDVDVRVLATTTKDLYAAAAEGSFMTQLADRLKDTIIESPSLAERRDDIPELVQRFLRQLSTETDGSATTHTIGAQAMEKLMEHSWPSGITELQNTIRRAKALAQATVIGPDDIFFTTLSKVSGRTIQETETTTGTRGSLEMTYRARILKSLEDNGWNFSQTAQELGIGRTTLWRKVKKYNLKRDLVSDN